MEFVTVLFSATANPGSEKRLGELLASIVTETRAEPGCIIYELHGDEKDAKTFHTYEQWTTQDALAKHLKMPYVVAAGKEAASLVHGGDFLAGMKLLNIIRPK